MSNPSQAAIENPAGLNRAGPVAVVLGLCVLLCLALRLPGLDGSLMIDEAGSIAQASARDYWSVARQDVHPPLFYMLLRAGLEVTASVPFLRLFSVACGIGLAALAVWAMRPSVPGAVVAGATVALLPQFVFHSQQLRPYALVYLLLGIALALAARPVAHRAEKTATPVVLAVVLLAAAATHLVTVFFLVALVPLLVWGANPRPLLARALSLWPLVPAGLLLLWFKFGFVSQPKDIPDGWWLPPTDLRSILAALAEASGWNNVEWLSDAAARRWSVAGGGVLAVAATALVVAFGIAWRAKDAKPLNFLLPITALVYLAALVCYSMNFEPILLGRILVPGLLPLGAGLAWGIGHHPRQAWRWIGVAAVAVYLVCAILPTIRRSFVPVAGLRGLAETMRNGYRPGDRIILFRSLDYGLAPYWPQLAGLAPTEFNATRSSPAQLAALRGALADLGPDDRIWLAYRDDYYFRINAPAYEAVRAEIAAQHRAIRVYWHENDLTLLLAEPPSR
ncbi:MAG TPA: hypothetical protein VG734_00350 [Lacunisphaera sp.]|nr:hypothetical protein [Lacunisphaera sp.]